MAKSNGENRRLADLGSLGNEAVITIVVPNNEAMLCVLVPHEFIDQVEMFSKLIGISKAEFVRFAVYELVHTYKNGSLKKLADGD